MSTLRTFAGFDHIVGRKPYRLEIEFPGLPDLQSLRYKHWARRHAHDQKWKQAVGWMVKVHGRPLQPLERADIDCIRYATRECDADNCAVSFKPLLDGLKGLVIVDDSPKHVQVFYRFEKVTKRAEQRVRIVVTERVP